MGISDVDAVDYITRTRALGIKPGLKCMLALLERLGNPQNDLQVVHVTGTNGKGSFTALLASALRCAGYTVGQYVSPWSVEIYESVLINGTQISPEDFASAVCVVKAAADGMAAEGEPHPTEFELTTAVAFLHLKRSSVDLAIIEVGMGGLLDATNVFKRPMATVFQPISMDHTRFLGDTVEAIASNKAGIMKSGCPAIVGPQCPEAMQALRRAAAATPCPVHHVQMQDLEVDAVQGSGPVALGQSFRYQGHPYRVGLLGTHQVHNAAVAALCARVLRESQGLHRLTPEAVSAGLQAVQWPCRFEVLQRVPCSVVIDGAHNPQSFRTLKATMAAHYPTPTRLVMLLAMNADKDVHEALSVLVEDVTLSSLDLVATQSVRSPNPLSASQLGDQATRALCRLAEARARTVGGAEDAPPQVRVVEDLAAAVQAARALTPPAGLLLITGSLYMVGHARQYFLQQTAPASP